MHLFFFVSNCIEINWLQLTVMGCVQVIQVNCTTWSWIIVIILHFTQSKFDLFEAKFCYCCDANAKQNDAMLDEVIIRHSIILIRQFCKCDRNQLNLITNCGIPFCVCCLLILHCLKSKTNFLFWFFAHVVHHVSIFHFRSVFICVRFATFLYTRISF